MKPLTCLLVMFTFLCVSLGRSQSREFEAASIKPTKHAGVGVRSACRGIDSKFATRDLAANVPLGRCVISAGRLSHMIGVAYGVTMDVLQGGPEWVKNGADRFDLEAKAEDPSTATEEDLLMMLRNLLADRFKLKFHRATREIEGFRMVVSNNGPKIREAGPDDEEKISFGIGTVSERPTPVVENNIAPVVPAKLIAQKVSMPRLAQLLQAFAAGHIEDQTNLKGFYNIDLVWERGQDISEPMQEQLGLKLEKGKIPVAFFFIDSAERPSVN
jgi:uncharacterized protein (TIGR03435 family)